MSELPPRPWDWVTSKIPGGNGSYHLYIVDAEGRKIAALWGKPEERMAMAVEITTSINAAEAVALWEKEPIHEDEIR